MALGRLPQWRASYGVYDNSKNSVRVTVSLLQVHQSVFDWLWYGKLWMNVCVLSVLGL